MNGEFRVDSSGSPTLLNCLMYKMCYYRFGEMQVWFLLKYFEGNCFEVVLFREECVHYWNKEHNLRVCPEDTVQNLSCFSGLFVCLLFALLCLT